MLDIIRLSILSKKHNKTPIRCDDTTLEKQVLEKRKMKNKAKENKKKLSHSLTQKNLSNNTFFLLMTTEKNNTCLLNLNWQRRSEFSDTKNPILVQVKDYMIKFVFVFALPFF